jgi:hypothetical protein
VRRVVAARDPWCGRADATGVRRKSHELVGRAGATAFVNRHAQMVVGLSLCGDDAVRSLGHGHRREAISPHLEVAAVIRNEALGVVVASLASSSRPGDPAARLADRGGPGAATAVVLGSSVDPFVMELAYNSVETLEDGPGHELGDAAALKESETVHAYMAPRFGRPNWLPPASAGSSAAGVAHSLDSSCSVGGDVSNPARTGWRRRRAQARSTRVPNASCARQLRPFDMTTAATGGFLVTQEPTSQSVTKSCRYCRTCFRSLRCSSR